MAPVRYCCFSSCVFERNSIMQNPTDAVPVSLPQQASDVKCKNFLLSSSWNAWICGTGSSQSHQPVQEKGHPWAFYPGQSAETVPPLMLSLPASQQCWRAQSWWTLQWGLSPSHFCWWSLAATTAPCCFCKPTQKNIGCRMFSGNLVSSLILSDTIFLAAIIQM